MSISTMEAYKYTPLDLTRPTIRLIQLHAGHMGDEISCSLVETHFDVPAQADQGIENEESQHSTMPPYEALSYTWGGTSKPYSIVIEGHFTKKQNPRSLESQSADGTCPHVNKKRRLDSTRRLPVTQNLYDALQHLRKPDTTRTLWIDAICIDQNNDIERGHQVRQMQQIYRRAEQVIVWLGLGNNNTALAFMVLTNRLYQQMRMVRRNPKELLERLEITAVVISKQANAPLPKTSLESNAPGQVKAVASDLMRTGIRTLLKSSWFSRIWIIQEIASNERAVFKCGHQCVSRDAFFEVVQVLDCHTLLGPWQGIRALFGKTLIDRLPPTFGSVAYSHGPNVSRSRPLKHLLERFRTSEASDPRDKIYALYGLAEDREAPGFPIPDYTKSEKQLVQDAVHYFLTSESSLDMHRKPFVWDIDWDIDTLAQNLSNLSFNLLQATLSAGTCAERGWKLHLLVQSDGIVQRVRSSSRVHESWDPTDVSSHYAYKTILQAMDVRLRGQRDIDIPLWLHKYSDGQLVTLATYLHQRPGSDNFDPSYWEVFKHKGVVWASCHNITGLVEYFISDENTDLGVSEKLHEWEVPMTALHMATKVGHIPIIRALLASGRVDALRRDEFGRSPLLDAAGSWNSDSLNVLLQNEDLVAKINESSDLSSTLLFEVIHREDALDFQRLFDFVNGNWFQSDQVNYEIRTVRPFQEAAVNQKNILETVLKNGRVDPHMVEIGSPLLMAWKACLAELPRPWQPRNWGHSSSRKLSNLWESAIFSAWEQKCREVKRRHRVDEIKESVLDYLSTYMESHKSGRIQGGQFASPLISIRIPPGERLASPPRDSK